MWPIDALPIVSSMFDYLQNGSKIPKTNRERDKTREKLLNYGWSWTMTKGRKMTIMFEPEWLTRVLHIPHIVLQFTSRRHPILDGILFGSTLSPNLMSFGSSSFPMLTRTSSPSPFCIWSSPPRKTYTSISATLLSSSMGHFYNFTRLFPPNFIF